MERGEYVRGDAYTNTAECRFSLMKRAVLGAHHSVSEAYLPRYLVEWDFKFNTRKMTNEERAALTLRGTEGPAFMYRNRDAAARTLAESPTAARHAPPSAIGVKGLFTALWPSHSQRI
jgi:hypothetical protein